MYHMEENKKFNLDIHKNIMLICVFFGWFSYKIVKITKKLEKNK